jgi:adenosine kinase
MSKIIISGSLVYDHIMNFPDSFKNHILPDKVHMLNVSFVVDRLQKSWGGTAGNIAYTAKMLGADPFIISALGSDSREYIEHFNSKEINTSGIVLDDKQPTASAYITTDADDNQITAFFGGPLSRANEYALATNVKAGQIMIVSPTDKRVMIEHVIDAANMGLQVVFDPGQQITAFTDVELKQMISRAKFLIGNDYEMHIMHERTGMDDNAMLETVAAIITTLGAEGSVIKTKDQTIAVPPCMPDSVDDPTGAGDAYRAGFFTGIALGYSLQICGQMGSVAASYAIETYGTQAHEFTKDEFSERYEKTYKEKISI